MTRLLIVYADGFWNVVREDAKTISLFSSTSAVVADEWRLAHSVRRAA